MTGRGASGGPEIGHGDHLVRPQFAAFKRQGTLEAFASFEQDLITTVKNEWLECIEIRLAGNLVSFGLRRPGLDRFCLPSCNSR